MAQATATKNLSRPGMDAARKVRKEVPVSAASDTARRTSMPRAQLTSELDDAEIAAVELATMPPGYEHLDAEMTETT